MTPAHIALLVLAGFALGYRVGSGKFPSYGNPDAAKKSPALRAFRGRMSGEAQRVERAEMEVVA